MSNDKVIINVRIVEGLSKVIPIEVDKTMGLEAACRYAVDTVKKDYYDENIILTADDCTSVSFDAVEMAY